MRKTKKVSPPSKRSSQVQAMYTVYFYFLARGAIMTARERMVLEVLQEKIFEEIKNENENEN